MICVLRFRCFTVESVLYTLLLDNVIFVLLEMDSSLRQQTHCAYYLSVTGALALLVQLIALFSLCC